MVSIASSLAALNLVIVALGAVVAGVMVHRIRKSEMSDDVWYLSAGIASVAGGFALQRLYWAINRSLEAMGEDYILTQFYSGTSWVTIFPLAMVILGMGLIIEPILVTVYGGHWFCKYTLTVFLAWATIAVLL